MINSIDIVTILFIFIFFAVGWHKGIMRFIVNILGMIAGAAVAFYYFTLTENLAQSAFLLIGATIALSIIFSLILKVWNKKVSKSKKPMFLSRLLGGLLALSWSFSLITLFFFAVLVIPTQNSSFMKIKSLAGESYTYAQLEHHIPLFGQFFNLTSSSDSPSLSLTNIPINEEQIKIFSSSKEFQDVYKNESLQSIINDEDLKEKIESRDINALLNDPKIKSLMQDEDFMKDIMGLYSNVLQNGGINP